MVRCKKCGTVPDRILIKYTVGNEAYIVCPNCKGKSKTKSYYYEGLDDDAAFIKPEKEWNHNNRRVRI